MECSRTTLGKINRFHFYSGVLIWVEGDEDIPFYKHLLDKSNYKFSIKPAGGNPICKQLARALINRDLPYVVVMDGDYDILQSKPFNHRRVIILDRYSMENYFVEVELFEKICLNCARVGHCSDQSIKSKFNSAVKKSEKELKTLIQLEIALYLAGRAYNILPDHIGCLLENSKKRLCFRSKHIKNLYDSAATVEDQYLTTAQKLVTAFTRQRRLIDLLRGHLALTLLQFLILQVVRCNGRRRYNITIGNLLDLLSAEIWELSPNEDHDNLRNAMYKAVEETSKLRNNWPTRSTIVENDN